MSDCFGGFLPFSHGKLNLTPGGAFQTGGNLPTPEGNVL
mgnify:CR=1 FL=1